VPGALFLEQARYALWLRKMFARENISHLHATSSRALVCGLLVKKLLGLSLSGALESRPAISRTFLKEALGQCSGGRTFDPQLVRHAGTSFMIEPQTNFLASILSVELRQRMRSEKFWQEWSQRLLGWSQAGV